MSDAAAGMRSQLTPKGRAMRERIIEAAATLIFRHGAQQTSMDDVKAAAGASKSQLYHYFADKDELLRGVIELQGERVIAGQQPELGDISSPETLRRWRDKLVELADRFGRIGGCPLGALASELAGQDETLRAVVQHQLGAWATEIARGLARMQEHGCLRSGLDPAKVSAAFLTTIQGGLLITKVSRSTQGLEAALDLLISTVIVEADH